ncbi:MAG: hypothetical protein JXB07_05685 [Anaerolineae bacterium]|nr:hypothetical protein [Anaerolineae bacterium]
MVHESVIYEKVICSLNAFAKPVIPAQAGMTAPLMVSHPLSIGCAGYGLLLEKSARKYLAFCHNLMNHPKTAQSLMILQLHMV